MPLTKQEKKTQLRRIAVNTIRGQARLRAMEAKIIRDSAKSMESARDKRLTIEEAKFEYETSRALYAAAHALEKLGWGR